MERHGAGSGAGRGFDSLPLSPMFKLCRTLLLAEAVLAGLEVLLDRPITLVICLLGVLSLQVAIQQLDKALINGALIKYYEELLGDEETDPFGE